MIGTIEPLAVRLRDRFPGRISDGDISVISALARLRDRNECVHSPRADVADEAGVSEDDAKSVVSQLRSLGVLDDHKLPDGQTVLRFLPLDDEDATTAETAVEPSAPEEVPAAPAEVPATAPHEWEPSKSQWEWNREIRRCKRLSVNALRVAMALCDIGDSRVGTVYLDGARLAVEIGRTRRRAEKARAELRDAGWISEAGWSGAVKRWRFTFADCDCGNH